MTLRRRAELLAGILVGVTGIAGLVVGISLRHDCTAVADTGRDTCSSAFSPGSGALRSGSGAGVVLICLALVLLCIVVGALMHAVSNRGVWRALLWLTTLVLLAGTLLTLASVGPYLVAALALAIFASVLASRGRGQEP